MVRSFHAPKVSGITFVVFKCFLPLLVGSRQPRLADQDRVKQAMFETPFLVPSPDYGRSSVVLEKAALSLRWLPKPIATSVDRERPYGLSCLRVGL